MQQIQPQSAATIALPYQLLAQFFLAPAAVVAYLPVAGQSPGSYTLPM